MILYLDSSIFELIFSVSQGIQPKRREQFSLPFLINVPCTEGSLNSSLSASDLKALIKQSIKELSSPDVDFKMHQVKMHQASAFIFSN